MIVLASSSPRRAELLQQIDIKFVQQSADIDETPADNESPNKLVERLAREKACAVACHNRDSRLVLGADTIGLLNDEVLVKPVDFDDFVSMLSKMSGQTHVVITSVAVARFCHQQQTAVCRTVSVSSEVTFKELTEQEIVDYWHTGEPADKAGGYGIQGRGGKFVTRIEGSYSGIVGLPLYETAELLRDMQD